MRSRFFSLAILNQLATRETCHRTLTYCIKRSIYFELKVPYDINCVYMPRFIVALLRLWLFSCWIIVQIMAFNGPAGELVQNSKVTIDCYQCAGGFEIVANDSHIFQLDAIETATITKCCVHSNCNPNHRHISSTKFIHMSGLLYWLKWLS